MSDTFELIGQRALVTGGTKGIGEAVAARLRELGATVLITARTRPDELPPGNLFVAADVATPEGCAAVAIAVTEQLGGIDVVVLSSAAHRLPAAASQCSTRASGITR